jgi:hypothetical protein
LRRIKMFRKAVICGMVVLFLAGCGGSDNSGKDTMSGWGTKKSTAVPPSDFPGAPADNKWNGHKGQ